METEIIQALSNVNINSDTAEAIMAEYIRYQYVKLAIKSIAMVFFIGVMAFLVKEIRNT